ncbi:MAG: hypothetical protein JXA64_05150 [Candidatus Fermentibacteraceae bacterium]|nr:hypothetical protein [Candidatus Fermentibacteraceae bacterium]
MKTLKPENLLRPEQPGERRLVYHYSPRRSLLISGLFLAAILVAGLFIVPDKAPVRFVLGIFALALLLSIRKECSVRIWEDWPYVVYEYHSLLRHFREYIAPWEISGLSPDITSMWRGNISERLIMEVGDRELVITPFYSERDAGIIMLREELGRLPDSRQQAEYELELERRVLHPEEYPVEEPELVDVWGFLEMSVQCPRCDGPVMVNGPYTSLVCPQCSADIEMDPDIWADLLEDLAMEMAEDCEEGTGGKSTIWGTYNTELQYGRLRPYCPQCKRDFDLECDRRENGKIICPDCGAGVSLQKPPEWFGGVFRGAFLIAGAEESSGESNIEGNALNSPVVFTCSKCGAAVRLDGSERNISCEHCDEPVNIPDDLWLRFHPAPVKKRWFVGYKWEVTDSDEE